MAHVDLHKINELLQKIQHEDSSDLAQAKATGKDHKLRSGRYHDMAQQDTEGMSDGDMVDVIANLYYRLDKVHALESVKEEECSACGGTGWDRSVTSDEDDRGCDECGGTGEVDENIKEDSGCPCCGCDSVAECTCSPDCPNCDCHRGVTEDEASDLYHDNVKKVGQKNYNDYKGIQLGNLEKQLKQVLKTLLALTDIENKDNSSDMVNDLRNMHGALSDLQASHNSAYEKLQIGRHRKESSEFQKRVKEAEQGSTEYYRELDKNQLDHTHQLLMKAMSQLNVAIAQRSKFGKELMGSGDRAGTGHLYGILQRLEAISNEWDKETELYGN